MIRIANFLLKHVAKWLIALRITWPFVFLYKRTFVSVNSNPKASFTLLALNPDRFRGDLEALAESGAFQIWKLPFDWQSRILALFWPKELRLNFDRTIYYSALPGSELAQIQEELRQFLSKLLFGLRRSIRIDAVISAAIHYRQDYEWGFAANQIGIPFIVLHRENIIGSEPFKNYLLNNIKSIGKFKGDFVIVHNNSMRDLFLEAQFLQPEQIASLGALRMDKYVNKVKNLSGKTNSRKRVTFFSFHHGVGLGRSFRERNGSVSWSKLRDDGYSKMFEKTHVSFVKLAQKKPHIDFVIKPKWGGSWLDEIEFVLKKYNINQRKISNLFIIADTDVHDLIISSDVVCCFGSTTLFEAAIASKPVIIPYFVNTIPSKYHNYVRFKDHFDLFDVAHDQDEFQQLIINRLKHPTIDEQILERRYRLFEEYVSSMQGDALEKYIQKIQLVIKEKSYIP